MWLLSQHCISSHSTWKIVGPYLKNSNPHGWFIPFHWKNVSVWGLLLLKKRKDDGVSGLMQAIPNFFTNLSRFCSALTFLLPRLYSTSITRCLLFPSLQVLFWGPFSPYWQMYWFCYWKNKKNQTNQTKRICGLRINYSLFWGFLGVHKEFLPLWNQYFIWLQDKCNTTSGMTVFSLQHSSFGKQRESHKFFLSTNV